MRRRRQEIDIKTPKKEATRKVDKLETVKIKKVVPAKRERQESKKSLWSDKKEKKKHKKAISPVKPKCLACHLPGHQWKDCPEEELKTRFRNNLLEKKKARAQKGMNKRDDSPYLNESSIPDSGTVSLLQTNSGEEHQSLDTLGVWPTSMSV